MEPYLTKEMYDTINYYPYCIVSPDYNSLHTDSLHRIFTKITNEIVAFKCYKNNNCNVKEYIELRFEPGDYAYIDNHIGRQLSKNLKQVVGNSDEAYEYYVKMIKQAFPDFEIKLEKVYDVYENVKRERLYQYKLTIYISNS